MQRLCKLLINYNTGYAIYASYESQAINESQTSDMSSVRNGSQSRN